MNRADLIDRLEKLTGPDREVDAEIALHFGARHRSRRTGSGVNKGREWFVDSIGGVEEWSRHPPASTASIDAAVALVEKMLPGWGWDLVKPKKGAPGKCRSAVFNGEHLFTGSAYSPEVALLLALLRALEAEGARDGN